MSNGERKIPGAVKDSNGVYVKTSPVLPAPTTELMHTDVSIDQLMSNGLLAIQRIITCVLKETSLGEPSRESVMNLKDCMTMLHELKKKEAELLENMTDDELERLVVAKNDNLK